MSRLSMKTKYEKLSTTSDKSMNIEGLVKNSLVNCCMLGGIENQGEIDGFSSINDGQTTEKVEESTKSTTSSRCISSKHSVSNQSAAGTMVSVK